MNLNLNISAPNICTIHNIVELGSKHELDHHEGDHYQLINQHSFDQ